MCIIISSEPGTISGRVVAEINILNKGRKHRKTITPLANHTKNRNNNDSNNKSRETVEYWLQNDEKNKYNLICFKKLYFKNESEICL